MEILDPNNQQYGTPRRFQPEEPKGIIKIIMNISGGRITNTTQASYILLVIIGIIVVFSVYMLNKDKPHQLNPQVHRLNMKKL